MDKLYTVSFPPKTIPDAHEEHFLSVCALASSPEEAICWVKEHLEACDFRLGLSGLRDTARWTAIPVQETS